MSSKAQRSKTADDRQMVSKKRHLFVLERCLVKTNAHAPEFEDTFAEKFSASTIVKKLADEKLVSEIDGINEFNYDSIPSSIISSQEFANYRYWQLYNQLQRQKLNNHVFRARMINNTRKLRKEWQPKPNRAQQHQHQQRQQQQHQ